MSELDCPLDDETLIEAVMTMNAELARTGAKTWRMHIPVDLSRDSDILIAEIARRFRDTRATLAKYRKALEEIKAQNDAADNWALHFGMGATDKQTIHRYATDLDDIGEIAAKALEATE